MTVYQPTKIKPIIAIAARMIKNNPKLLLDDDFGLLHAQLREAIPELKDPSHCPNCGGGMKSQKPRIDYHIVTLLQGMARIVRDQVRDGVAFTEANKTHVNSAESIAHEARTMTGKASDLGLIAPVDDRQAYWAITRRGWAGLRGEKVPAAVETFRRRIINRPDEEITFAEAIANSRVKNATMTGYDPSEWYQFGEDQEGKLL